MDTLPTGTVSFLFTDIEGSTRLWQEHPEQMRLALAQHDIVLRDAIMANAGYVFKTGGDGYCAAFDRAPDAVVAILAAQQALQTQQWPAQTPIRVRMGLHCGAAEERDGDYFGPVLNSTARLMSAAHGGQALISLAALELIGDQLPHKAALKDLGLLRLKDLPRPIKAFQLVHPDLPASFPPLRGLDSTPNNLPQQLSSFVGREKEIAQIKGLLGRQRLVTLIGSGGAGKTRLALQTAAGLLADFPDGVWLVEMGALPDPALLPQALASVLCVPEEPSRTIEKTLTDHLRDRNLLLLLDNGEHLPPAAAKLIEDLLKAAPGLRLLATGRDRLRLPGEQVYPVPPLPLPGLEQLPSPDDLLQIDSVRLFVERVTLAMPEFELSVANSEPVARLCHRLDGMPLPIELAAAQAHSLPVELIAERLDDRFRLLTHTASADLLHQKTLGALIDWSCDRLSEPERIVLRRLAVFAGGWTSEAAQNVCGGADLSSEAVAEALDSLAQKRLVLTHESGGDGRYRMLDSLREYALRRLEQSGESDRVRIRHRDYFLELAEQAVPLLNGPYQEEWLTRLDIEEDNLRSALFCNVSDPRGMAGRLRLAGSLWLFWRLRGHISEGQRWLTQALSVADSDHQDPASGGVLGWARGRLRSPADSGARELIEECQAKLREMGSQPAIAGLLTTFGDFGRSKPATTMRDRLDDGLAQIRKIGSQETIAGMLTNLKSAISPANPREEASRIEDKPAGETVQSSLGGIAAALERFAQSAVDQKQFTRAARLFGTAHGLRLSVDASSAAASSEKDKWLGSVPPDEDREALAAAWNEGSRMTWQQAIDYALSDEEQPPHKDRAK